jgi:hypothetical protein
VAAARRLIPRKRWSLFFVAPDTLQLAKLILPALAASFTRAGPL